MDERLSTIYPDATQDVQHTGQCGTYPPPPADEDDDTNTALDDPNLGSVITRIESLMESFVDALAKCQELSITLTRRPSNRIAGRRMENIRFPGRTVQEARKFARILLILQLSHDALVSGTILTKRHIFYQHQDLFEKQTQVDELVDNIAFTLGIGRGDLNIVAASKGLLAGPLIVHLRDGTCLDPTSGELGTPIPISKSISSVSVEHLRWILVVEKDAIFTSLCSCQFWRTASCGPGAILTAKGYPDLTTRAFLSLVQTTHPQLPILGLMDFDPHGISIFKCYRDGSQKLSHEAQSRVHGMRWLGIHSTQLVASPTIKASSQIEHTSYSEESQYSASTMAANKTSVSSTFCRDPITYLTSRDRKTANKALNNTCDMADNLETMEIRRELQVMLVLNFKAEIEWLDECGNLCYWLDREISLSLY